MRATGWLLAAYMLSAAVICAEGGGDEKESEVARFRQIKVWLADGSTNEQLDAAGQLAGFSAEMHKEVVSLIAETLADMDQNVRIKFPLLDALGSLYSKATAAMRSDIKKALFGTAKRTEENGGVRAQAILLLANMVRKDAFDDREVINKIKAMESERGEDERVVGAVVQFMFAIGELPKSFPPPTGTEESQLRFVQALFAYLAAGKSLPPLLAQQLLDMLRDKARPVSVRIRVMELLSMAYKRGDRITGVPDVFGTIAKSEKDMPLRTAAIKAVGRAGDAEAARVVIAAYEENKGNESADAVALRITACETAGEFFPILARRMDIARHSLTIKKLTDMLVEALNADPSSAVGKAAAYSLGNMNSPRYERMSAVSALIEALKDKDEGVRTTAYESLKLVTGEDLGQDHNQWRKWYEKNKEKLRSRVR